MREQSWTCYGMYSNCICLKFYGVEAFRIPLVGKQMSEFGVGCIFYSQSTCIRLPSIPIHAYLHSTQRNDYDPRLQETVTYITIQKPRFYCLIETVCFNFHECDLVNVTL
jgi:hypothetical protein